MCSTDTHGFVSMFRQLYDFNKGHKSIASTRNSDTHDFVFMFCQLYYFNKGHRNIAWTRNSPYNFYIIEQYLFIVLIIQKADCTVL